MAVVLILIGLLAAFFSMMFVSEATLGVWIMAGAIYLAALARIAQAAGQHNEVMNHLRGEAPAPQEPKSAEPAPAVGAD